MSGIVLAVSRSPTHTFSKPNRPSNSGRRCFSPCKRKAHCATKPHPPTATCWRVRFVGTYAVTRLGVEVGRGTVGSCGFP